MTHHWPVRVYYEDTDLAGIVYYANYLRFIERARTEMVRAIGVDQVTLKQQGIVFAVRRVEADYILPAKFDDQLDIRTTIDTVKGASLTLTQIIHRDAVVVFSAKVVLVTLSTQGRALRIPADIATKFTQNIT
jgi:acyl-CoA thioester hydrolase